MESSASGWFLHTQLPWHTTLALPVGGGVQLLAQLQWVTQVRILTLGRTAPCLCGCSSPRMAHTTRQTTIQWTERRQPTKRTSTLGAYTCFNLTTASNCARALTGCRLNANLKELCSLLLDVLSFPTSKAEVSFAVVYPSNNALQVRQLATVRYSDGSPSGDTRKTLHDLKFESGDYLDVTVSF